MRKEPGYREPYIPPSNLTIVMRRESALTLTGQTRYTIITCFDGPMSKAQGKKFLEYYVGNLPKNYPAGFFLWSKEDYEKILGQPWIHGRF